MITVCIQMISLAITSAITTGEFVNACQGGMENVVTKKSYIAPRGMTLEGIMHATK